MRGYPLYRTLEASLEWFPPNFPPDPVRHSIVLGYGWPAYQSYKATVMGSPDLQREWLIYW